MQTSLLIDNLADNYMYSPIAYLDRFIDVDKIKQYFVKEIDQYLSKQTVKTITTNKALATIEPISFDSEILALKCARMNYLLFENTATIDNLQDLIKLIDDYCQSSEINYINTRFLMNNLKSIQLLELNNFITIDNLITFALVVKQFSLSYFQQADYYVSILDKSNKEYIKELCEISKSSFVDDRFHNDPVISKDKADEVYKQWLINSCNNQHEKIIIANDCKTDKPLGFVICNICKICDLNVGIIVLIAVDQKSRKHKVGYNMLIKSIEYFKQSKTDIIQVGTQLTNFPAQRLYLRTGFKPVNTITTLRKTY